MLRLRHLLVLAIATIVCAGIAGLGFAFASVAAPVEVVVVESAKCALRSPPAQQWRSSAARPAVDRDVEEARDAVESDIDDDDIDDDDTDDGDAGSDVAVDPSVALRGLAAPRNPARALRADPQHEPSRFEISRGFSRGPPV